MQKNKGGWGKKRHPSSPCVLRLVAFSFSRLSFPPDTHARNLSLSFSFCVGFFSPFALTHTVQVGEREREREHLEEIKPSVFGHLRN